MCQDEMENGKGSKFHFRLKAFPPYVSGEMRVMNQEIGDRLQY